MLQDYGATALTAQEEQSLEEKESCYNIMYNNNFIVTTSLPLDSITAGWKRINRIE